MTDTPASSSSADAPDASASSGGSAKPPSTALYVLIAVIVLALVGGALGFAALNQDDDSTTAGAGDKKWQAVFLTNGQVYFGHIGESDEEVVELTDIYYLQVQQTLQPSPDGKTQEQSQQEATPSLAKLGRFELHCPEDEMQINRSQVLFWEDLKAESKVVQAIDEYAKTGDKDKKCYEPAAS